MLEKLPKPKRVSNCKVTQNKCFRRGGLVVERRTPERVVWGSILVSTCCILEQDTFTSEKV